MKNFFASSISLRLLWSTVLGLEFSECWDLLTEVPTSGWKSFMERSSLFSLFSLSDFREVPGSVLVWTWTREIRRISSSFYKAPGLRLSALLTFWDDFLVTFPSISSQTSVVYSSSTLENLCPLTSYSYDAPLGFFCGLPLSSFCFSM